MRIALVDPSLFTLPYDAALASGLLGAGNDVVLHGRALRPEDATPTALPVMESYYRLSESRFGRALPSMVRLGLKGLDHGWSTWRLIDRLRRERPDVIHCQWLPLPLVDFAFLRHLRQIAPIVLTVHDTNPFNGNASASLQRFGVLSCLKQVDRLIVHTEQGRDRLCRLGIASSLITVLPHGMLVDRVVTAAGPMDGGLVFLLFGKIRPYKGLDLLIDAFAALPPELRDQARLRIVGKPYMEIAPLLSRANEAGVSIELETGYVPDEAIAGLFGPDTVAMFPYREIEASGVLFLALAHGRPIIASRLGAFAELLTDGVHGHLVPPGDVGSLSAAMRHMLSDRRFTAACAAHVSGLAGDIPGWDQIARRTLDVYRQAGASRSAPGSRAPGPASS